MTTKLDAEMTWVVRIDIEALWGGTRPYKKHVNVLALATTAERAIEMTREHFPKSTVWAVTHQHKGAIVLIDDANDGSRRATEEGR